MGWAERDGAAGHPEAEGARSELTAAGAPAPSERMRPMRDADILERLGELGLELPPTPEPVASYVPVTQAGALAFVAGQVAMVEGRLMHPGRLGQHVSVEMGQEAAARAALQALSAIRHHLGRQLRSAGAAPPGHGVRRRRCRVRRAPDGRERRERRVRRGARVRTGATPERPSGWRRSPWERAWRSPSPPRCRRSRTR